MRQSNATLLHATNGKRMHAKGKVGEFVRETKTIDYFWYILFIIKGQRNEKLSIVFDPRRQTPFVGHYIYKLIL